MSRSLSNTALADLFKQESEKVWLFLLRLSHATLGADINVVNNTEDITSAALSGGSVTFTAFPFAISLPAETEDEILGSARLVIDNVDRSVVNAIRSISSPPTITLAIVLSDDPDNAEIGPINFTLQNVSYNALTVEGNIGLPDLLNASFPRESFNPNTTPGLF
jgi:hypothetical protein